MTMWGKFELTNTIWRVYRKSDEYSPNLKSISQM